MWSARSGDMSISVVFRFSDYRERQVGGDGFNKQEEKYLGTYLYSVVAVRDRPPMLPGYCRNDAARTEEVYRSGSGGKREFNTYLGPSSQGLRPKTELTSK